MSPKNQLVEPLKNDHPYQRPRDQLLCVEQCFLLVRSLTNDDFFYLNYLIIVVPSTFNSTFFPGKYFYCSSVCSSLRHTLLLQHDAPNMIVTQIISVMCHLC